MKLANKIFLSIFLSALAICLSLTVYIFIELKSTYETDFETRYSSISDGVTNSIVQFESMTHSLMKSAVFHVEEVVRQTGMVSNDELKNIAKRFSISGMGLVDKTGVFIRSTNDKFLGPNSKITLDVLCPEYMQMYKPEAKPVITPILASKITGKTYKFYVSSILNGKYVLNLGSKTFFLTEAFENILAVNPEVNAMALFTASGHKMAEVKQGNFTGETKNNKSKDRIYSKVIPVENGRQCCECRQKGFLDESGEYYYKLVLNISTEKLDRKIAFAGGLSISVFVILAFISYFLSRFIANRLIIEIDEINIGLKKIMKTGDLNYRFSEEGSKEIHELESNLNEMVKALKGHQEEKLLLEKEKGIAEANRQVAHDIRSPLSALNVLVTNAKGSLPEDTSSVLQAVARRIEQIAEKLVHKSTEIEKIQSSLQGKSNTGPVHLQQVIRGVVIEKQIHAKSKGIEINFITEPEAKNNFSVVEPVELYRVISNIINNSIEAISETGEVTVHLDANPIHNIISIQDNGKGVRNDNLPHVFKREATFDKESGTGLGLYHAQKMINQWGGEIYIESDWGVGTEVIIELPIVEKPVWFVTALDVRSVSQVILLDDESANYKKWSKKFEGLPVSFFYFSSFEEFSKSTQINEDTLFLIDYEFENSKFNGLDIANEINDPKNCIIVSGRNNEPVIIKYCLLNGVRYLYKGRIESIEIEA